MVTYSSDLFWDTFCVYTQSSDAMGLIFQAKLTVCFISKKCDLYVWKKIYAERDGEQSHTFFI